MSEKRRDSKGRLLRTGETQRKDGLYQYRYKDVDGERRVVYERDLQVLRQKEKEIMEQLSKGVSFFDGGVLLSTLIDEMFSLKKKWRDSTRQTMLRYVKIISKYPIYSMPINKIKIIDCKSFLCKLHEEGYAFGTINSIHTILKMSFEIARDDNAILKNPADFMLKSLISDNTQKVVALSDDQVDSLFDFLAKDPIGQKHIDMFVVLIGTGLRISEFSALTMDDIDFKNNIIRVRKQVVRLVGKLSITELKSNSAYRDIPMTNSVRSSIINLIKKKKDIKLDKMIDGYTGFISTTKYGRPRQHAEYDDIFRPLIAKYNAQSDIKIEKCTPHVLRHTFCTRCIAAGMDVKSVQYLMGHSDATTTLNVYADNVFSNVVNNMKLLDSKCG